MQSDQVQAMMVGSKSELAHLFDQDFVFGNHLQNIFNGFMT